MIEIRGRYNTALVYTDALEELAASQIRTLCDQEFSANSRIRIMPDVHAGAGCTVGTTMTIRDRVVPNLVGVDIGCGMEVVRLGEREVDCARFDAVVRSRVPSGFDIREKPHPFAEKVDPSALRCASRVKRERALRSVGSLGGGNHFIELNRDGEGRLYLIVHSGSRHVGLEVANLYQSEAVGQLNGRSSRDLRETIAHLKRAGRDKEIDRTLKELRRRDTSEVPPALAWVSGALFRDYLHDMALMQAFAEWNRRAIVHELIEGMGFTVAERFTTVHNTIDTESMILRKGAVPARKGERFLLPMNMRDGSLICVGKGNPEWNCSAPHGAGRLMSRTRACQELSMNAFRDSMSGIFTTSVSRDTLDEAPMAYKPMEDILRHIGDTAEVERRLTPIYNFKAAE